MLQSRGSIFIGGREVLVIARRTLLGNGSQEAREVAPELGDRREASYRWKTIPP